MSAPAYMTFPNVDLPGGQGSLKLEIFSQVVRPTPAAPYLSSPVYYNVNPWLVDGIPETVDEQLPEEGIFGGDSMEFIFADIDITGSGQSLYDLLHEDQPENVAWHIRIYYKPVGGSFSDPADFHGVFEPAEHAGEIIEWGTQGRNAYKVMAKNPIFLLQNISVDDWIQGSLPHATYDYALQTWVDGQQLAGVFHNDTATPDRYFDASLLRYFYLRDIMETINDLLVFGSSVNDGHASGLAAYHSWELGYKDTLNADQTADLDDVVLVSRIYSATEYLKHFMFFDFYANAQISVYSLSNVLEVLKQFLVPYGCHASFRPNASGNLYLEIREIETGNGHTVAADEILMGMEISEGERAKEGFRVVVANSGESVAGDAGSGSIDCCYMCPSRLRGGDRWTHGTPDDRATDDLSCLYQGAFVGIGSYAFGVYKFTVKNAGAGGAVHQATISTDPTLRGPNGQTFGEATLEYWFEHLGDPTVLPEGIFRRYTKTLRFKRGLLDRSSKVGDYLTMPGGTEWVVRKKTIRWFQLATEYECEKGCYEV